MQTAVGGYIQLAACAVPNWLLVVNEDGMRLQLPVNEDATKLYAHAMWAGVRILGPALMVPK
jgi:hypothetical protein